MSEVLARLRNESSVEFLETSRNLEIYTFQRLKKLPRRHNHFRQMLEDFAVKVYNNCKLANSVFLKDEESLEKRTNYFDKALSNLYLLSSQIDIAKELKLCSAITNYQWARWLGLIYKDIELIKKVQVSDKSRIK